MSDIGSAATSGSSLGGLRERYVEALLAPDVRRARAMIADAVEAGAEVRAVYLEVLTPALHEVGRLWAEARIGVGEEHLATAVTQSVMARLGPLLRDRSRPARGQAIVVACPGQEMHGLGAQMVTDFLEGDGWDVLPLGPYAPPDVIVAAARERAPVAVALSAAMPDYLGQMRETCAGLHKLERPPFVLVGGQALARVSDPVAELGADASASDPVEAVRLVAERLAP